jgi:hypothetical protein
MHKKDTEKTVIWIIALTKFSNYIHVCREKSKSEIRKIAVFEI